MNFLSFGLSDKNNMFYYKFLILYHTFEVYIKAYKHLVESGKITKYPADIQLRLSKLNNFWINLDHKAALINNQDFTLNKKMILEIIELMEFLD